MVLAYQGQGQCQNNSNFVQIITRLSDRDSKELNQVKWWPEVDTSMYYILHPDKTKVYKYVLHARHGHDGLTSLKTLMGDNFVCKKTEALLALANE